MIDTLRKSFKLPFAIQTRVWFPGAQGLKMTEEEGIRAIYTT